MFRVPDHFGLVLYSGRAHLCPMGNTCVKAPIQLFRHAE
jgi:hypothetical protein